MSETQVLTTSKTHKFFLRPARPADIPAVNTMIAHSVRTLHASFYPGEIIESAVKEIYIVDGKSVDEGWVWVIEGFPASPEKLDDDEDVGQLNEEGKVEEGKGEIVTVGGYSFRSSNEGRMFDPETEAAKLKAMYVHPSFTRLGLGNKTLEKCEGEVKRNGYRRLEFGATVCFLLGCFGEVLGCEDGFAKGILVCGS